MLTPHSSPRVHDAFCQPLAGRVAASPHTRPCPEFSDAQWLHLGLQRVLAAAPSGRAFLQEHAPRFTAPPSRSNYFAALASERRCALVRDLNHALLADTVLPDRLAHVPELARYECFALDAHWHRAATHDPRHNGVKLAVGHGYSLDLRGHQLRHLTVGEGRHEHDMTMLKRLQPTGLRHAVPQGRRVLLVYDRAALDFAFWKRCRHECAVYFLSRVKAGMAYDWVDDRALDTQDPRNRGVTQDQLIATRDGQRLRIIHYTEPEQGRQYEFLTNEPDLPPGVLAELYRRRWEVEQVFAEVKNKLGQQQAWGTSLVAKAAQGQLVALTHNLLLVYEHRLEQAHAVSNAAEDRRRAQRVKALQRTAARTGRAVSTLLGDARRATQRSVKFIRWLRHAVQENLTEAAAVPRLATLYASL